ncbi:hypothetical protein EN858_14785 [Mesorhizobium sp. M4B.F.Ca.ET.215.01.1.1]|uniref:hypothetical protein n=1 Tax=unclassified Mesorhizobium TaxID=325217 RepID=UPI001093E031|nr:MULTISPECIES: hypothetical protein [unclassified Mesorhizobium]TGQ11186.1 hypothetical protein EN858_14785 [Mesorhizobium sp. M4B.F.Ca.ET.215.01.1.1]TGR04761.1 hypothetical protein EN846_13295 [Mesorhizobium sp. M4B.F.Ca.ET.203.01.1.1]
MPDHERIWLESEKTADRYTGRMWCEDKVWPDDDSDGEPTEYVRSDLYAALLDELARQGEALKLAREALDAMVHAVCGESGFANAVRVNSGFAYPWPALDEAEALAIEVIMERTDEKYR